MKYIVITTKHHDGFCLFDSKFTDYDVMSTPFKRDIMKEIADAARENELKIGWYHSIMDWHDPDAQQDATFPTYEWRMRAQVNELLTHYGEIGIMWFDGEWIPPWNDDRGKNLYLLCRALQPNIIVNNRVGKQRGGMTGFTRSGGFAGDYATPEQQIPDSVPPGRDWETCMTMNGTWGYKRDDVNWKSTTTLIRHLIDIASKGGNFLLNVGPTGSGDIPDACVDRLNQIGKWMALNGESIHGTSGSPFSFKLPFGRCTQRPGRLYLHVLDWPDDHTITVPIRNDAAKAVLLAESDPPLEFSKTPGGIMIKVPAQMPDPDATVVALDIDGVADVIPPGTLASRPATTRATTRSTTTRTAMQEQQP
jgi:alpha-L-fucosidase